MIAWFLSLTWFNQETTTIYRNFAPIPCLEKCIPTPNTKQRKVVCAKRIEMQKRKRSKGGFNCAAGRCEVKSLMHFYHFWRFLWDPSVEFCNENPTRFFPIDRSGRSCPPKTSAGAPEPDLQQISCKGGGGDTKPQVSSNEIDGRVQGIPRIPWMQESMNLPCYHGVYEFPPPPVRW